MKTGLAGAIDIGGTKISVGIVDANGRIQARAETETAPELGYPAGLARTCDLLAGLLTQTGFGIDGIGVGSTGPIDPLTGIYGDVGTLPGWQGSPLADDLRTVFGVPVAIENDADAAALGEATWGAGQGSRSLIYVTFSTGIGAGILLDGKIYRGAGGAHPEIGHHILDASGPLCYCGAHGCWESLASGPALEAWFRRQTGTGASAAKICELARQRDPLASQAVQRASRYIGLGLSNLITMFCPQTVVLGGGLMQSANVLLPGALEVLKQVCTQVPLDETSIVVAALGRQCGLLGAASVWLHAGARGNQ